MFNNKEYKISQTVCDSIFQVKDKVKYPRKISEALDRSDIEK